MQGAKYTCIDLLQFKHSSSSKIIRITLLCIPKISDRDRSKPFCDLAKVRIKMEGHLNFQSILEING